MVQKFVDYVISLKQELMNLKMSSTFALLKEFFLRLAEQRKNRLTGVQRAIRLLR
jgi:hypothetical protein